LARVTGHVLPIIQAPHAFCNDGTAGKAWLDVSKSLLSGRNDESPKSIVESGEPIRD
jgi:hypothetical protein